MWFIVDIDQEVGVIQMRDGQRSRGGCGSNDTDQKWVWFNEWLDSRNRD